MKLRFYSHNRFCILWEDAETGATSVLGPYTKAGANSIAEQLENNLVGAANVVEMQDVEGLYD